MAMTARERIQAMRQGIAADRSKGLKPYKWKPGITSFRILPAPSTAATPEISGDFSRKYGKTYLKSFDGKSFFGIGDRDITYGEPDPIREMLFDAWRQAGDEDVKKHYREMIASPREIFCALILDDPNQKVDEPVLIEVSQTAFDGILAQFETWTDADPDYDVASLTNGHVFKCEKQGTGMDTKYTFTVSPKKAPLKPAILEKAIDLDAWIKSQFEGLEQKALEFLGRLNGAAGITTNAGLLTNQAASSQTPQIGNTRANGTSATVTVVEDDELEAVVDAVFEDASTLDEVLSTTEDPAIVAAQAAAAAAQQALANAQAAAAAAAANAAAAASTAAAAKANTTVATPAAATAAVAQTESDEIDDILAGLQ